MRRQLRKSGRIPQSVNNGRYYAKRADGGLNLPNFANQYTLELTAVYKYIKMNLDNADNLTETPAQFAETKIHAISIHNHVAKLVRQSKLPMKLIFDKIRVKLDKLIPAELRPVLESDTNQDEAKRKLKAFFY